MTVTTDSTQLSSATVTALMERLCRQLQIAFSVNRVLPSLADLEQGDGVESKIDNWNALGRDFGLRFREMSGSRQDLISSIADSGPALIRTSRAGGREWILALEVGRRSRLKVFRHGVDQVFRFSQLQRILERHQEGPYQWLLVQPLLASGRASRFQFPDRQGEESMTPLRRFIEMLRPEARDIRTIIVFSIVIGLLSLTTPLAVEAMVNTIAFGRYLQPIVVLSIIVFVFLIFRAGLNVLMTTVSEVIQRKLFVRTVEDLSYRLTRVPLATWKQFHGPELVNRFFDVVSVQKITSKLLLDTLMLFLQTIIGLTVLAFYHPFLLGYDIGLLVMMTIVLWVMGRGAVKTARQESELKYNTAAWLQEIVRHPSTYKFNGGLNYAINRADELTARYVNERQQHFRILIRQITFASVMQAVAATVLLALGGYLVVEGQMTLGQLVAAELIVTVILGSFAKLGKDLESFYDLMASVDKLGKLFDLPIEPLDRLHLARREGACELSVVDRQAPKLNGSAISNGSPARLAFTAGKTHAIYHPTERARREWIEWLTGQQRPESGFVLLNEYRIDTLAAESLQEQISLVRDVELFEGSVDENIRMGRDRIGSRHVTEVVERMGLHSVISRLDEGYATRLNISGHPLSQGEAIRVVLARSLIRAPGILIIDGLLDRLSDDETEQVWTILKTFAGATTIICATGRKSIARWADDCLNLESDSTTLGRFEG